MSILRRALVASSALATSFVVMACGAGGEPEAHVMQAPMAPALDASAPVSTPVSQDADSSATSRQDVRPVLDADKVVAARRAGFRRCYATGLRTDPKLTGRVVMKIDVAPTGEITAGETVKREGLTPQVAECLLNEMKTASFVAPGGTGTTLMIPVSFVISNQDAGASTP